MIPISLAAVEYLTINMRDVDAREIYNMRWHTDPYLLAREVVLATSYGKAAIATYQGRPCAIIGCSPLWPGVWSMWSFGTDEWSKAVLEISRYGKNVLDPFIRLSGGHRAQCESHIEHTQAHRWLMAMGAKPDGMLNGYGRDGSTYIMFSWS